MEEAAPDNNARYFVFFRLQFIKCSATTSYWGAGVYNGPSKCSFPLSIIKGVDHISRKRVPITVHRPGRLTILASRAEFGEIINVIAEAGVFEHPSCAYKGYLMYVNFSRKVFTVTFYFHKWDWSSFADLDYAFFPILTWSNFYHAMF
ncbi:hypothetical protein GWI33_000147 [Rhynchophorus ferrugineus]|uniref:Uncharacterized protein n=1 Tax=Rhynchophorus ferrugineus TaxID=354439 RepID=A0A834IX73_RHYFE|nr:hypothetical protein GWI33_000147 [Rhynchophorus ferrugineus]